MSRALIRLTLSPLAVAALMATCAAFGAEVSTPAQSFARGDYASARRLYEAEAQAGTPIAQFRLALMLVRGLGGPADADAAHYWLGCALRRSPSLTVEARALGAEIDAKRADRPAAALPPCPAAQPVPQANAAPKPRLERDGWVERLLYLPGDATIVATVAVADTLGLRPVAVATTSSISRYGNQLVGPVAALWWLALAVASFRLVSAVDAGAIRLPRWRGGRRGGATDPQERVGATENRSVSPVAPAPH